MNVKYLKWICPTKSKKWVVKKWDGGFIKKIDASTGKTLEIFFIEVSEDTGKFKRLLYYEGDEVPFKGTLEGDEIEISEEEYESMAGPARTLRDLSERMFSSEIVDAFNESKKEGIV